MNLRINEPGLIYRIFIARKSDNPLLFAQELSTQFGMEQDDEDPGLWHSTDGFAHVQLRDPEINDTMIVEYLGNAAEGWKISGVLL